MSQKPPRVPCSSILLVEDHAPLLRSMAFLLEVAGFEVNVAANGIEALDVLARNHPDLMLSDIDMPVMNGYELLRQVRADRRWHNIPVIFTSHRYTLDDVMRALDVGADGYLPKPFDFDDLLNAINDIFPERSGERLKPSA